MGCDNESRLCCRCPFASGDFERRIRCPVCRTHLCTSWSRTISSQCRAGGGTGEDAFSLRKLPRTIKGLGIGDLYHLIHKRHIHGVSNKIIADTLNVIVAMLSTAHRRANRISQNALYLRILLLEILHNAGIGAAAASSGNQEVNLSVQIR